jgi:hypothetical protein
VDYKITSSEISDTDDQIIVTVNTGYINSQLVVVHLFLEGPHIFVKDISDESEEDFTITTELTLSNPVSTAKNS